MDGRYRVRVDWVKPWPNGALLQPGDIADGPTLAGDAHALDYLIKIGAIEPVEAGKAPVPEAALEEVALPPDNAPVPEPSEAPEDAGKPNKK